MTTNTTRPQQHTIDKLLALMREDGFVDAELSVHPFAAEATEFPENWPTGILDRTDPYAVIVFRDFDDDGHLGEHIVPDTGLVIDSAGRFVDPDGS